MVQRNLFKTRLCVLYQRGRCSRPSCSFAHGDSELRGSFRPRHDKRDYRGGDLRNKLDKRSSPQRSYSPGRDSKRQKFRGLSPSRSLEKKSDRKHRQKHLDGPGEFSGSLKISDNGDRVRGKTAPSDSKVFLHEQLKEVQLDINMLEHQKLQLESYEDEKSQEADVLSSRIKELEAQLQKEKEECRRLASKIKKFIKAHNRHARIQDELKRSQARIQKLGHQLVSDATKFSGNEEDLSTNIMSDGERPIYRPFNSQNDKPATDSPHKRKVHIDRDAAGESAPEANLMEDGGQRTKSIHLKKISRWSQHPTNHGPGADDRELKREKISTSYFSADKVKDVRSANVLPSTGKVAHALDENVEVEVEKIDGVEIASDGTEKGATCMSKGLPFRLPPPPPLPRNTYLEYVGDDENVNVLD